MNDHALTINMQVKKGKKESLEDNQHFTAVFWIAYKKTNVGAHSPSCLFGQMLVGRFHKNVHNKVKPVNHLSAILLEMMLCLRMKPVEPCLIVWLWNNGKRAKTCKNKATRTTGHPSSAGLGSRL